MTDKDPFSAFENERTVIKPSAGRAPRAEQAPAAPANTGAAPASALAELPGAAGLNPLVQAAAPLLAAGPALRAMPTHPNPLALRDSLAASVRQFESTARAQGLPNEQVVAGRYILCSFIDECASSTPWGGGGMWGAHSLLVQFQNESWGGEKVFQLLTRLIDEPIKHRNLLELIHVVLALGFEGRYRVLDNGRAQLEAVRERLALVLRQNAPTVERELSPRWQGIARAPARLVDGIPLWVIASIVAALLCVVFVAMRLGIHNDTSALFDALQSLDVKPPAVAAPPPPPAPPAATPRLSGFLAPEVAAGQVQVRDLADRSIVTIAGDGFFEPGSAEVATRVRPLLGRIAEALNSVPGAVLVAGHTDSQPIHSLRYPSNWHLSQERADAVKALLASTVDAKRLRAEGRADSQPVDSNATPTGRARNRRVEITLTVARAPS